MKKFLQVLAIIVATCLVIFVVFIVILLKNLPSPATIGQYLKPSNIKTTIKSIDKKEPAQTALPEPSQDAPKPKNDGNFNVAEDRQLVSDLLDETKPLSDVCNNLRNASGSHLAGYSFKDFGQGYKDSVMTNNKDPMIQAMKPMIKFLFTKTALKDVLLEAQEADARGDKESLLEKAGFYAKIVNAYRDITNNKAELENVMDRSYHLLVMGKIIAKKPELLNDNQLNNYCSEIEKALNADSPTSFEEERAEFNKFIQYTGVDPKEVGYDPNYRTNLNIAFKGNSLKVRGGWIDSMIKPSPEEIKALEEMAK